MSLCGRTAFAAGLAAILLHGAAAQAQGDGTAAAPPSGAYFPPAMASQAPTPVAAPADTTAAAPIAAPPVTTPPPQWVQGNSPSASGSQTCSMTADLGSSWSMSLTADQAAPSMFTLGISGPYAFPSDGPQRLTLYYDRGFQTLAGTASGSTISIPLDASSFPQFLHGFTASRSMLIAEGAHPAFSVNLIGSSAAVSALGQCTEAEGFTQLPPPWHAAATPAAVASTSGQSPANGGSGADTSPGNADAHQTAGSPAAPIASAQGAETSPALPPSSAAPEATPASSDDGNGRTVLILILLAGAGVVAWRVVAAMKRRKEEAARDFEQLRRRRRAHELIEEEIDQKAALLGIRRSQLVFADFYGTPDLSKWGREMELFCSTRLAPLLEREGLGQIWPDLAMDAIRMIEQAALSNSQAPSVAPSFISNPAVFDPRMDPLDYERHCALLLRDAGWDATLTPATGDQGADVIAEKAGVRLVVQCKLYSSQTVGNDAVQQAFAAKNFQRAQLAAVVSNAPFTPSARQLAMTTGVLLLHHEELRTLMTENIYGSADEAGHI